VESTARQLAIERASRLWLSAIALVGQGAPLPMILDLCNPADYADVDESAATVGAIRRSL
jgi:hypothetical protein